MEPLGAHDTSGSSGSCFSTWRKGRRAKSQRTAISPDGRWIASASDTSVRLWPMPDVTKPPLHTLPQDELLARLDTFTNLRAVRDETSSTGWSLEVGPFLGWETAPEW